MTVAELRAALAEMPDDAEVLTQGGSCGLDEVTCDLGRGFVYLD